MKNIFICGANKGIGLEFICQLLAKSDPPTVIFASYRNASNLEILRALQESAIRTKVILIRVDPTQPDEIEVAQQMVEATLGEEGLDLFVNNVESCEPLSANQITIEDMEKYYNNYTVASVLFAQALYSSLEKSVAKQDEHKVLIVNIPVLQDEFGTHISSLQTSKAALHMATHVIATEVKEKDILTVMMCPDWIIANSEEMEFSELTVEQSVSDILKTLDILNNTHHGTYTDRFGKILPF